MNEPQQHSKQCRCFLRKISSEYDATLRQESIPDGYCGRCCECNALGHTRVHPYQGYSDAWCDKHWQAVLDEPNKPWYRRDVVAFIIGLGALTLLAVCA